MPSDTTYTARRRMQEAEDRRQRESEIAQCGECDRQVRKRQDGTWTDCDCTLIHGRSTRLKVNAGMDFPVCKLPKDDELLDVDATRFPTDRWEHVTCPRCKAAKKADRWI